MKALAAKYRGQDVVVIGVHTPELARERVPDNVADAVRRLGVTYPVVLDPHYAILARVPHRVLAQRLHRRPDGAASASNTSARARMTTKTTWWHNFSPSRAPPTADVGP